MTDFWADYEVSKDITPGLIISNHTSVLDMYMYLLMPENPCFLSKKAVMRVPMIGFYARLHQCIFFDRSDKSERNQVLDILEKRVRASEKGEFSPIIVFPEGTTANGRSLMKFKKGPF